MNAKNNTFLTFLDTYLKCNLGLLAFYVWRPMTGFVQIGHILGLLRVFLKSPMANVGINEERPKTRGHKMFSPHSLSKGLRMESNFYLRNG